MSTTAPLSHPSEDQDTEKDSLQLLHEGSADEFIARLKIEVAQHPALNHIFLHKLAQGDFPNVLSALRDYAHQYSFYSQWFTKYLGGVIDNLEHQHQKDVLLENMEEEKGIPDSPKLEDRPHVELFSMFKVAVGADKQYCDSTPPCTTVQIWRDLFLQKCQSSIKGVGLGAIGLGTEYIISSIYPYIIQAIENHTDLDEQAGLFFRLHVECDDGHAENIEILTREIAEDTSTREAIRFGVLSSLNLRKAFWDAQLSRAERIL